MPSLPDKKMSRFLKVSLLWWGEYRDKVVVCQAKRPLQYFAVYSNGCGCSGDCRTRKLNINLAHPPYRLIVIYRDFIGAAGSF